MGSSWLLAAGGLVVAGWLVGASVLVVGGWLVGPGGLVVTGGLIRPSRLFRNDRPGLFDALFVREPIRAGRLSGFSRPVVPDGMPVTFWLIRASWLFATGGNGNGGNGIGEPVVFGNGNGGNGNGRPVVFVALFGGNGKGIGKHGGHSNSNTSGSVKIFTKTVLRGGDGVVAVVGVVVAVGVVVGVVVFPITDSKNSPMRRTFSDRAIDAPIWEFRRNSIDSVREKTRPFVTEASIPAFFWPCSFAAKPCRLQKSTHSSTVALRRMALMSFHSHTDSQVLIVAFHWTQKALDFGVVFSKRDIWRILARDRRR